MAGVRSDKGPLRWDQKDTILKLHTGAGKTLLGLLMRTI